MAKKKGLAEPVKAILQLSASTGQCANPDCDEPLIKYRTGTPIKNFIFAHIRDENPPKHRIDGGPGWRYYPADDLSPEARNKADNILLLCPVCHQLVDKSEPGSYSVSLLKEWKERSEASFSLERNNLHNKSDFDQFEKSLEELSQNQNKILGAISALKPNDALVDKDIKAAILDMLLTDSSETIEAVEELLKDKPSIEKATDILKNEISSFAKFREKAATQEIELLRKVVHLNYYCNPDEALRSLKSILNTLPSDPAALNLSGNISRMLGKLEEAFSFYDRAIKVWEKEKNQEGIATILGNQGNIYKTLGDLDKAVEFYRKSEELHAEIGCVDGIAVNRGNLGLIEQLKGHLPDAKKLFESSYQAYASIDHEYGMANQLGNLGIIEKDLGDTAAAKNYYNKALLLNRRIDRLEGIANQLGNLGALAIIEGNLPKAIALTNEALEIDIKLSRKIGMVVQYSTLGNIYSEMGELDSAVKYYKLSLKYNEELGRDHGIAFQHYNLGMVGIKRRDQHLARKHLETAKLLFQKVGLDNNVTEIEKVLLSLPP